MANLARLARQNSSQQRPGALCRVGDDEVGDPILEEGESSLATFVGRFQRIFQGLAEEVREARRTIRENHRLREENQELREALSDCVEACGRYIAPLLEDNSCDPEQDDHSRARDTIERARRLLDDGRPRLSGS